MCNLMVLSYKSMTCAIYLRELTTFTFIFHIVPTSHSKSIKSIDKI